MLLPDSRDGRLLAGEETGYRIDEDLEERIAVEAAGLPEGEDTSHPAASYAGLGHPAPIFPEQGIAQPPFGMVVRGFSTLFMEKFPEVFHFRLQTPDKDLVANEICQKAC